MNKVLVILVILLSFGCAPKHDVPISITLDDWQFKKSTDTSWYQASVPGNVHSDLLKNDLIDHPFIGNNETKLQWISESDWEYKTTLKVDDDLLRKRQIELNFDGLDTYASVFLNDSLILKTNNAFLGYKVDVSSLLKTSNELRILFEYPAKYEKIEQEKLNYSLPEEPRIFTRKAQFQYGWDWGPKMNTFGIWRPVKLIAWNEVKIDDIYLKDEFIDEFMAILNVQIQSRPVLRKALKLDVFINDTLSTTFDSFGGAAVELRIDNPKLWWPHNMGDPYLYNFKFVIRDRNTILDSVLVKKGLRKIELVTEKDLHGESFYFKVNGQPIFAKGANYIPQNSMQNQVKRLHYVKLINAVVSANMNMLRVWGGGIYENDIFYDLCDEKGILVWQDFMFACAMYPGDDNFLDNVQQEANYNVKRLRNNASIALWCGNNENSEGWHRWGWQEGRTEKEKEEIWMNYLKTFDSILPNAVALHSNTDYWETSPKFGRGNPKYKFEGDAHDWWVWHDAYPFEHLEKQLPRFMSEFGFQSFPAYETIDFINQNDSLDIASEGFKNHQKHRRGFELINEYMKRDFPVPETNEDYVYMSQLLQAYGISKGILAQRRARPYTMGSLYWQLNDCWPAVSWSSLDFFGNWKALHYKVRRAFENSIISTLVEGNSLKVYAVNDALQDVSLELGLKLIDFKGDIIWSDSFNKNATANSSDLIFTLALENINFDYNSSVFVVTHENRRWLHYFTKPKSLNLEQQSPEVRVSKVETGFKIELTASTLLKDVFLYSKESGFFSDNYFDLLAGENRVIYFKTKAKTIDDLTIKTFNKFIR